MTSKELHQQSFYLKKTVRPRQKNACQLPPANCRLPLLLLLFLPLLLPLQSHAQQNESQIQLKFSGFANAQLFYDTRQMVEAREAMVSLFPKAPDYDSEGNDINARPSFNQLAMTSRLRFDISGPDVLGATSSAAIEGDFTGQSNHDNNGFRLREAWAKLQWEKTSFLIGSYWHPLYAPEIRPFTIGLNTGAPFHAFSRHNQIRVEHRIKDLNIILFAGMQRDYASNGPLGRNPLYQQDAGIPNLDLQLQYHLGKHILGGGIDLKFLQPMLEININDTAFNLDKKFSSWGATAFARFELEKLSIKMQTIWGQNLTEHIMLGGYQASVDAVLHDVNYTNSSQISYWIDLITKGKKWKFGLFSGYAKNLGLQEKTTGNIYMTGYNIDYIYRLSPRVQLHLGKMMFATELEYTVAAYGMPDLKGIIENAEETGNLRVLVGVFYFF